MRSRKRVNIPTPQPRRNKKEGKKNTQGRCEGEGADHDIKGGHGGRRADRIQERRLYRLGIVGKR